MTKAEQRKRAVKLTLPVFCGYIVLGIAFGATLAQAGYGPVWALAISTLVYAGSLQFVMVPFLAGGTSLIAVALTAADGQPRAICFTGFPASSGFGRMDKRIRPYMITSLTDETYSVFCGLSGDEEDGVMFRVTLYDQIYWVIGSILGTLLAQGLPFDLTGIDFSMTGAVCRHLCGKSVGDEEPRADGHRRGLRVGDAVSAWSERVSRTGSGPDGGSADRDGYPKGGARMSHAIAVVAICAVVTIALRALPFVCFGGKKGVPRLVSALGETLPPAIMAALVVYCLKSVPFGTFGDGARS